MNVDIGESDHEFLTPEELERFCPRGNITKVECMVDSVHPIPYYSTGEIVRCDKYHGLVCNNADNFPIPCNDYKIRYYCKCPVETKEMVLRVILIILIAVCLTDAWWGGSRSSRSSSSGSRSGSSRSSLGWGRRGGSTKTNTKTRPHDMNKNQLTNLYNSKVTKVESYSRIVVSSFSCLLEAVLPFDDNDSGGSSLKRVTDFVLE
ncbi:unnamed protein product [Mytilus edulis]|uniref:WxxW domain-containing protein n=1 Tax=Mytilus edulis TaxID=6550 RepID=A0A8S3TY46_MYTED|nr:unnamed protein product [Mytilus edulis]